MQSSLDSNCLVKSRLGRDWRFSPEWQDGSESIVFDANSGDFWVVPELSRSILVLLGKDGILSGKALAEKFVGDSVTGGDLASILDDLVKAGLIMLHPAATSA